MKNRVGLVHVYKNRFIMEKIIKMNGYVYLVQDFEKKGFETFYNLGKDPDDDRWEDRPNKNSKKKKDED